MILLLKTHVSGYTRRDGTYVAPYEDDRPAGRRDATAAPLTRPARIAFALREPVATLTGNEFGVDFRGPEDMPALRRAAVKWYRDNLQGTRVINNESGRTIIFGAAGAGKTVVSKGEDVVRLVPALKEILARGRFFGAPQADRLGRPGVRAIHTLEATVSLDGRLLDVVAIVRETDNGEFYYDLRKDNRPDARWAVDRSTAEGLTSGQVPTPALEGDAEPNLNIEILARDGNLAPWFAGEAGRVIESLRGRLEQVGIADKVALNLRDPEDMPALRRAAKEWYDAHLRGTTVTMKDGRVVRFVRKGMGKSTSGNKGDILLRAVPAIKAIVEHGQVVHVESGRKNVEERLIVAARVRLGEETYPLAVSVHRTPDGHYEYDFTFDRSAFALADSGSGKPRVSRGGLAPRRPLPSLEVPHPASGGINLFFWQDAVKASRLEAVTRDLEGRLREVGIADKVALEFRDRIEAVRNGTASPADGRYVHGLIEIALGTGRERRTLDHETIHALRRLGLFRDAEWRTLERRARADTDRMASIRERYGRLGLSEDALVEEAIADMFADWSNGRLEAGGGLMRVAFRRIRAFLEALGNALRGNGFQTAGDVFGRVERGEVGRRHLPRDDLGRFASQDDSRATAEFRRWAIGNRGTFDASKPSIMKAHPTIQGATRAARPAELNDGEVRRNPGEPSREQARSGRYNKPRMKWRGLTIAIENPAGSVRRGRGWEQRMRYDYGEIVGTRGVDGDPVDVFVGPNPDAPMVYVVHQRKHGRWAEYDEDKCMVGFDSEDDARAAFLSCYTDPRFLGPITAMPAEEFIVKVRATLEKPKMIKSQPLVLLFKSYVSGHTRRLRSGKVVQVAPYTDRRTKRAQSHSGQLSLFVSRPRTPNRYIGKDPDLDTPDMFTGMTRREAEPAASAPPPAEKPSESQAHAGGASLVPEKVLSTLRRALDQLREIRRAVDNAVANLDAKHGGAGRYEADVLTNRAKDIDAAMRIVETFRRHAPGNGVDAEKVLEELGGLPDLTPSSQAAEWLRRREGAGPSPEAAADPRRKFYVTMIREGVNRPAFLAGPFDRHEEALTHVDLARRHAEEVDPRAAFDYFGTASIVADKHPPGVLNDRMGIGKASDGAAPATVRSELPKRSIKLSAAASTALEIEVLDPAHDDFLDEESEGFRLLRKHTRDGRLHIPDDPAQIEAMASELTELANKADAIAEDKSHDAESRKYARADRTAMTALASKLRKIASERASAT